MMIECEKRAKAIDLSHHLSEISKARQNSPLKGLSKSYPQPGLVNLANGLPSPAYFPFLNITADILTQDTFAATPQEQPSGVSWIWKLFGFSTSKKEKTTSVTIPKYPTTPGEINLASALQYSAVVGEAHLLSFVQDFVHQVFRPAYEDYTTVANTGSTDGWDKVVSTLCNPGEGVLVEEWTYPSAMASMTPCGIPPVSVAMDSQGMKADSLTTLLSEWDEEVRGMKRPHVMYILPVGHNPKGTTMGMTRKKEIYDICVKYDIIIVEDDPYYFMQMSKYVPKSERASSAASSIPTTQVSRYISKLEPSFLRLDYEGRVIRLDTFSKTIAPGCRLGWFTCNPMFAERLERRSETCTQAPCGFVQAIITTTLLNWKFDGYIRWLQGLNAEYEFRRNFFLDCLAEEFHLRRSVVAAGVWQGCDVYRASVKKNKKLTEEKFAVGTTMFSFIPPTAGMFLWIKLHLENHPSSAQEDHDTLELKLWDQLAKAGVLFCPGWMFDPRVSRDDDKGHFRISFSMAETPDLKRGVDIFGLVIRDFFGES